ncbi:MAG TPA: aminotransferase [Gammaproteobacteria bacterium]|nr:aminotransferase [Gammaproteobacteria bacterium]
MYEHEFELDPNIVYLNHAAVAPWPKRTKQAVIDFATQNTTSGGASYDRWIETENKLREKLARLIGATNSSDIALQKNTSEALSTIAYGIAWKQGDSVVTSQQEFPSNRIVWQSLQTLGVETHCVDLYSDPNPEDALFQAVTPSTRLMAISSVQYACGLRMDLDRISEFCQQNNILLCVDAIQSLGAGYFNLQHTPVDFIVADGHKWMLGPEGTALLYVRPELRDTLQLHEFGWHMIQERWRFPHGEWEIADDATRFECGSSNMTGVHALNASLSLIEEVGIAVIEQTLKNHLGELIDWIDLQPELQLITPKSENRRLGIITVKRIGADNSAIYRAARRQGIYCAERGGGVRLSPHFYTPKDKLFQALEFIRDYS